MSNAVASVAFLQGQAWAKSPDGTLRALSVGSVLNDDEVLITAKGARIELNVDNGEPIAINGGQEVAISHNFSAATATTAEEALLTDASIQEAMTILEQDGDLLEELEAPAAGVAGGGDGGSHSFVQLTRIVEETDSLAFDYGRTDVTASSQGVDDKDVINRAPLVTDQTLVGDEDTEITGRIIATDIEDDALGFTLTTAPTHGALVLDPLTGGFIYTPTANYNGSDSFVVTVTDSHGNSSTTTITLNVTPVNDAPVSSNQDLIVAEDAELLGQIIATDIEGDTLTYTATTSPTHGVLVLDAATGEFTYTPNANYNGSDSFVVTISDGNGGTTTSTINIGITPVDDLPVISAGAGSVVEDAQPSVVGTLIATDVDNASLAFVASTQSGNYGSLILGTDGVWTYTLDARADALTAGETQSETFTVNLTDGSTTTVTVNITGTDDAPVISAGSGSVVEDTQPSVGGTLTATDADNSSLAFVASTQSGNYGSLILGADGVWTYTLDARADALIAGETQTEIFTVNLTDGSTTTVTVNITGTDDVPVISAGSGSVVEDTQPSTGGTLTATDADNAGLAFVASTQSGNYGSLILGADGVWSYTLDARADALIAGETQTETFTVNLTDGSTTAVTVNITGTDDAPVISAGSGSVVEDTQPSTGGTLTATDADNAGLAFVAATQSGNYGSLILGADGVWTYTLDARADALIAGETQTETFTVNLTDGLTTTVTVNITGTDDVPVISAGSGSVVEDTQPSTGGTLTATDADNAGLAFVAATQSGNYGSLILGVDGVWTYTLDARADALIAGETQTEIFTVNLTDGSTTTVTVNITGTDDVPVISAGSGSVVEDTQPATGGTLTAIDADNASLAFVASTQSGNYGSLILGTDGVWSYTLDARADALIAGETQTETFTVNLTDGSTTTVTVNITGTDDAPVISAGSGSVVEDTQPSTGGTLTATDADNSSLAFVATTQSGNYGSLILGADGVWTYTLDARADALTAGETQSETFTVNLTDGSTTTVTVNITGTDDAPVISAGSGSVVEDTQPSTGGTLTAADADNSSLAFVASTQSGNYGSLILGADGVWTYTLDARADALIAGETQTETFTVNLTDGSTTTVTVNITGTDDVPVISAGSGSVVEDTQPSVGGTLTATDADNSSLAFVAATQSGNYGSLILGTDGVWTYTLDARADALIAGETQTEIFTVNLTDGSTTTVTVNITGTDDAPVISAGSGSVVEDTQPSTGGTLTATDADNSSLAFIASTQSGNYGSLILGADGVWTYTLDARADALIAGETQTETFTVNLTDGSTTTVTVNITGTDDAPVISAGSGSVVEDTQPSTGGTLTATDADNAGLAFVASTQSGNYGSLILGADGVWAYTLDARADALIAGEAQTETFTVNLTDGSTTTVTVNITGTDDVPVISAGSGSVVEDTQPSTGGTLTATDADNAGLAFVASTQSGNYGSLILGADGVWTYTLDARADALIAGETQTEIFTVNLTDGSTTTVTVNITGTDDVPVISAGSGSVVEDTQPSTGGTLTATDADNAGLAFVAATQSGNYGSLILGANGVWTYTLDARADALIAGESQTETFTVNLTDGSTTTVTVNITGTDDAPVISAGSGSVVEDTQPSTGGTLTAADADNSSLAFVASTQSGNYGSLILGVDGVWTYTLDARADALIAGETQTETFTVNLTDGSTTTVTVNITGTDDAPVISAGSGSVVEDTQPSIGGTLTATDADNASLAFVAATQSGNYGSLILGADGVWSYTLDARADALIAGEAQSETFTVNLTDGSTTTVTVNITGTDDVPVISAGSGFVVEDTQPSTGGTLTATDADNAGLAFVASTQSGNYGSLILGADGVWSYTLDARADALIAGETQTETFTVNLTDGSTTTVTVNITGTDDVPVISAGSGSVVEDTQPSTGGTLTATDADNASLAFVASTQSGNYGSLILGADGVWSYTLDARADALIAGETQTEIFTVNLTDGSTTTVTVNITGTDDAPVISAGSGSVVEDTQPSVGGTLTATDADNSSLAFVAATQSGNYGSLILGANGVWSYTLDARADALIAGEAQSEIFTVNLTDGSTTTVTVNITGTDDAPVISAGSGSVVEDTQPSTGGTLTATDADNAGLAFVASTQSGNYGSLILGADGVWSYTLDARADALIAGETQTETFTVNLTDGSTTTVTVNITGTDDVPVISAGSGSVVEDTQPSTGGTLTATDADNASLAFVASTQSGNYGSLILGADGVWSYTLDARADALIAGETQTEIFTVNLTDGSTTTVTVNITGTDDAPVISAGSGSVVEDTQPSVGGTLSATDADNSSLAFVATTQSGNYGSLILGADGVWTYTLDARADALIAGETQTEIFTVNLTDGSTTTVTVNITGTDDAPVISAGSGSVVEDTQPSTGGTLTAIDADNASLAFVASTQSGNYGSLILGADGVWTYTLDARADVLIAGETQTEIFTVNLTDGSTTTVTVNITGTDDAPVISAGSGSVIEDTQPSTGGTLTATDADNAGLAFVASTQSGNYGSLILGADGVWSYTLDARADALIAGEAQTETFTVNLTDGSTTTVTVNITGTDDAPVISAGSGSVVEDTQPSTGGTLTATDADNASLAFVASTQSGNYGSLILGVDGVWTYTLDARADALIAGEAQTETFTVNLTDGSTTTVTVNITGTDDAPVISAGSGSVVEDTQPSTGGTLTATDADNLSLAFVASTQSGNYGSLILGANGVWSYTLDARAQALAAGQTQTENFTVTLTDGSTTTVAINITGTNDASVVTPAVANLIETNAVLTTSGTVIATDVDAPTAPTFVAQTNVLGSGGYGRFTLEADGDWTYTTTNAQNQFAAGSTYTDSLTVTSSDGSTSTITVNIAGTNDAPTLTGLVTSLNYTEANSSSITRTLLDSNVVLASVDSANFGGGSVTVTINNVVAAQDQLTVQNQGTGNNQISVVGTDVRYNFGAGAISIGTISGGTGGAPLTISLNNNATPVAVDALVQRIAYGNSSQLPNTTPRGVTLSIVDGDGTANGGTDTFTQNLTINVASTNDAPTLGALSGTRTHVEGGAAVVLDNNATLNDPELALLANFGGMTLTVGRRTAINADDDFVGSGTLSLTGGNVVLGGVTVGTYNTASLDAGQLVITFANGTSSAQATSVLRQIAYKNGSDNPPASVIVDFVLNDGNTGAQGSGAARNSNTASVTVNITPTTDPAVLGTGAGDVKEDTPAQASAAGTLSIVDYDAGQAAFQVQTNVPGTYGTFSINAAGNWTYNLDNTNPAVQALLEGETRTEVFTVRSIDGTQTTVTITVTGTNEGPVANDDSGAAGYSINIGNTSADLWGDLVDKGVAISFIKVDGTAGTMYERPDDNAIGVADEGRVGTPHVFEAPLQIEYNQATGTSEAIVFNFSKGNLNQATFSVSNLFPGENGGEVGAWEVYYQGSLVAADTFYLADGSDKGSFTINTGSLVFDSVKFTALNTNNGLGDGGDYFVTNFVGTGPASTNSVYTVAEGATLSITTSSGHSLLNNDTDSDGGTLAVTHINGIAISDGQAVTLPSGAVVTINTDGSFSYDTNSAFASLNAGQATTNSFTYTISDGQGGGSTATATMTIVGTGAGFSTTGTSGNDTIDGSSQAELIVGGAGNDTMMGALGADTFAWSLADKGTAGTPAIDTVLDFSGAQGDVLDVSDLLQGENNSNLTDYLHFTYDGSNNTTTVHISSSGGFSGGYNSGATDQTIVLNGFSTSGTDADIINQLKTAGQLITD